MAPLLQGPGPRGLPPLPVASSGSRPAGPSQPGVPRGTWAPSDPAAKWSPCARRAGTPAHWPRAALCAEAPGSAQSAGPGGRQREVGGLWRRRFDPSPCGASALPPAQLCPPLSRGRRSLTSLTRLPPETSLWAAALGPSQSPPSVPRPVSRLSLARQGHLLPDLGSRRAGAGVLVARTGQNELRQTALLWTGERVPRLPPTGLRDTNWVTERAAAGERPRNAVWPGAAGWHGWHRASRGLQPLPGCVSSPSEVLGPRGWTDRFLLLPAARACTPICPYGPHSPGTWGPRRGDGCG